LKHKDIHVVGTHLHDAIKYNNHADIVKELLKHKDIHVVGTHLHDAIKYNNHADIVKELLKHKDIHVVGTHLHDAIKYNNHADIVKELLKHKDIDVNLQDKDGETPLFTASDEDHLNIVRMLLDAGADINIKNNEDKTALDIAIERRQRHVAELIKNEQNRRNEFEESLKSKTLEELRALVETQVVWDRNIILQFIRQRRVLQRHSRRRRRRSYAPGGEGAQRAQKSFYDAANP
jgi:ankyrin repeat protein